MNKIAKRLVAGASAAALLVSAVGVDQLADLFTKTSYAASGSGKFAQSTGFNNLEQDTTTGNDKYNTGYGLHTNKTATALDDGRTFNVNLESWYVGENPVDVATILDASGSMAWTVDTLKPLSVSDQLSAEDKSYLSTKYGTDVLSKIQENHEGYLPQDVVDLILDKTNTDNTKLSYAGYKYYVYENRSSVSEFVPLGYWDGGKTAEKFSPIGYYPFNGTLENKAPDGTTATAISRVESGKTFIDTPLADVPIKAKFKNGGLNLSETDKQGNIIIDLSGKLDTTNEIEIDFQMYFENVADGNNPQSPIIYLGDGGTENQYFFVNRGNSATSGTSSSKNVRVAVNNSNGKSIDITGNGGYGKWLQCKLILNNSEKTITLSVGSTSDTNSFTEDIDTDKLLLVIGGNELLINDLSRDSQNLNGNYIKDLKITNGDYSASFSLADEAGLTDSTSGIAAKYYQQSSGSEFDVKNLAVTSPVEYIGNALNLTQTAAKNSAVKLDAKPVDSTYTIMFKVKTSRKLENKSGADDRDRGPQSAENLFYIGSNDTSNDYYHIGIPDNSDPKHLHFYEYNSKSNEDKKISDGDRLPANNGVFGDTNSKYVAYVIDGTNINSYFDIAGSIKKGSDTLTNELDTSDINVILAGLTDTYSNNFEISIDDLYIFDEALDEDQVKLVAENAGKTQFAKVPSALSGSGTCEGYHATMKDTDVDIAQISERLAQNPNDEERRGWYYVNSHSKWADIEGCLESGKQYIGIYDKDKDNGIDNVGDAGRDIATIPSGADSDLKTAIKAGNTDDGTADHKKFNKAPDNERSIRFYVDSQNHLRCFAWSGSTSKKDDTTTPSVDETDIRTFCSLVYEKQDDQITKYEELNNALNTFYQKIAEKSDLSNNAVVRFSTNSAINTDNTTGTEKTKENLKKLIMKDWTNWSDYYQKYKEDNSGSEPETTDYLQNLLIGNEKSSTDTTKSSHGIDEYPYVMTGGTYTWTGLKAFYDNMVNKDATDASQTAKDIANDARDKYLIIFTDGRDNTQDYDVSDKTATDTTTNLAGSPKYTTSGTFGGTKYVGTYNPYADDPTHMVGFSIKNYDNNWGSSGPDPDNQVQKFVTGDHEIEHDGDLAEAWADKLKDEGYTIYCVMMASGSISPTANADEYNKAKNFLKSLSGSNELDAQIAQMQQDIENRISDGLKPDGAAEEQTAVEALRDDYVIVVDPTVTGGMTVTKAFQQILEDIQLPRNDYTVQDYIDPRFDLIGEAYVNGDTKPQEVIYHLGANGEVTFTDTNNKKLEEIQVEVPNSTKKVTLTSGDTAGNIIDNIDKTGIKGLAYTPMESYMVNRKADSSYDDGYDTGNIGTGYIYYDNVKDMYYLRWTDQIIPMKNKSFDTKEGDEDTYLDVWSATIRLKAKDDFIGGNNILTNGNEAGENLVYSDATIDNMTDNPELYGLAGSTYREKLAVLSGTDRKINAVDADGVSQAVYGNGIDIPSSGFPRTTVNVRLLKLDAKNLNDVIYMGEVVSPTMMLADLEDGYMTGSYYLQYLERYAYRVYGDKADSMPLIELLNKWLKIDDKNQEKKTFTIPYIYLPDPEYKSDGTLATEDGKVKLQNSTGWDSDKQVAAPDFADLNLRDVTGFITYTWKRDDDSKEPQQEMGIDPATSKMQYDITKDYVVKNTNQIVYNLQLKFTPLKETADELKEFTLDTNFIKSKDVGDKSDSFFNIVNGEFKEFTPANETDGWSTAYGRTDYLQAMIQEKRTYTPHINYNDTTQKWELSSAESTVTDSGVYDWDSSYKKAPGNAQLEGGTADDDVKNIKGFYTDTPNNVNLLDVGGNKITDDKGAIIAGSKAPVSLVANTTYTKDVVNAALALELFVDGKYLGKTDSKITENCTFTFLAIRNYKDPYNKPSYATDEIGADASDLKYQLTFKVTDIPAVTNNNEIYKVWATLTNVAVLDEDNNKYISINTDPTTDTESIKSYLGYENADALPIGSYYIEVSALTTGNNLQTESFQIGTDDGGNPVYFKYLKVDNDHKSYTHNRFPENVSKVSADAATDTKDGEYQIWNNSTDNSAKNIAESNRVKNEGTDNTYTLTFNFGTVDTTDSKGDKGVNRIKDEESDYAKDRLGIIMLSADNNSLAITKKVDNTDRSDDKNRSWEFTVTVKPDEGDEVFNGAPEKELDLKWYKLQTDGNWVLDETTPSGYKDKIKFTSNGGGTYTGTVSLKHGEKVVITGLPEGTWQVSENVAGFSGTPHNDQFTYDEDEWQYNRADSTREDIDLTPVSQVNYINEFPYELPSTGGSGTVRYLLIGTALISVGAMLFAVLFFDRRKKARK